MFLEEVRVKIKVNMYLNNHNFLLSTKILNFVSISSNVHNHLTNVCHLLFDRLYAGFVWTGKGTL